MFHRPAETPRTTAEAPRFGARWAVGLFLLGLLLRLLHVATVRDSPFFEYLVLDPRMYDEWAQRIAAGAWLGDRPFFQDPLYAYVLAGVYRAAGHGYLAVVLVQSVLGALVAPLVAAATRRWFDRPTALVAGLAAALYLPAVFYDGLIEKTSLTAFLVAAHLALLSRAMAGPVRGTTWLGCGVLLGLAGLTRGNLLSWGPVLAAWLIADPPGDPAFAPAAGPRRPAAWKRAAALLLGCGLVVGVCAVGNRAAGGEWVLTTSNAGQNLYIGNSEHNRTGQYARLPFVDPNPEHEERGFAREAERRTGRAMSPSEVSRFWTGEALGWVRDHPTDWLRLTWRKLRVFWGAYEVPDSVDYYLYRETAPVLQLPLPGFGLVGALGLVGAMLSVRRRGWPRGLVLFVATYTASVVAFFVFSRFRMVAMPALLVLAAHGAVELVRRVRGAVRDARGRPAALRAGALGLAALVFVNLPVRGPGDGWAFRLATALRLPRHAESAATGHFNLGLAYAAQAKDAPEPQELLVRAEAELRRALADESRFAEVYVELGKVLARQGRDAEALELYGKAAAIEPRDYRHQHALGLLHARLGDTAAAEAAFRQALTLEPRHAPSAVELGQLLLAAGRTAEAEQAFLHALRVAPQDPAAAAGLERARAAPGTRP